MISDNETFNIHGNFTSPLDHLMYYIVLQTHMHGREDLKITKKILETSLRMLTASTYAHEVHNRYTIGRLRRRIAPFS